MGRSSKKQWGFGFDPSINTPAWAVVSENGEVHCGVIWNTYNERPIDAWAKLECLLPDLHEAICHVRSSRAIPHPVSWVVEGQYTARGKGSPDIQVRNGWISGLVYMMGHGVAPQYIALPQKWTRCDKKEERHEQLAELVDDPTRWVWHSAKPPSRLIHNVWDAIGLALWGLDQVKE